jgi:hypothetical protein
VLGGLVIAGAAVAIAIVLATAGSERTDRAISYNDIATSPQPPAVPAAPVPAPPAPAAPPPAATAPTADPAAGSAGEPDIEMDLPATSGDLEAECRKYQADRKWRELELCADKLQPADPKLAEELKTRAQEGKSAVRIAGVEAALRDNNLKRAKTELDLISPASAGYAKIKAKYSEAETQAITELAVRLDRVKDSDCEKYRDLLEAERAAKPPRVATEAALKTPCLSTKCAAEALTQKAAEQYQAGNFAASLAAYEQALACRTDPALLQKTFVVACNLRSAPKAKVYWKRLSPALRSQALSACVRNGITERQLDAP